MNELERRTAHRRAVEALIWGVPAVNYRLMYDAARRVGMDGPNQVVLWPQLLDSRNQTLTPNPDVIYLLTFYDTSAGPVVLEVPPADGGSITGSVMTCWQVAIDDVGTSGMDAGRGGRYLILPPGWAEQVPQGFIPMASETVRGYGLLRSIPVSNTEEAVAQAVRYARGVRMYPLAEAADPSPARFVEVVDTEFVSAIPYDARFFEVLDSVIQVEPWLERDRAMIDQLRSIGIRRGEEFNPDAELREVLTEAAGEAHATLDQWFEADLVPFADTARWSVPVRGDYLRAKADGFTDPETYAVDARAIPFTFGFFSSRHFGRGSFYLMGTRDAAGEPLDGASAYVMRVPADAPARQYWSAAVYARDTHTFLPGVTCVGRSSLSPGLRINADGSVDLYFGAEAPEGLDTNWVPTLPGRGFEVLFRLYGPTQALFDRTWRLPDLERITSAPPSREGAKSTFATVRTSIWHPLDI